jgi:hypothetical protein
MSKKTKLIEAFLSDGATCLLLFDYGDEWIFKIERLSSKVSGSIGVLTKVIKSVGKSPKQYR